MVNKIILTAHYQRFELRAIVEFKVYTWPSCCIARQDISSVWFFKTFFELCARLSSMIRHPHVYASLPVSGFQTRLWRPLPL